MGFRIVPIDTSVVTELNAEPPLVANTRMATLVVSANNDRVGPGDVLSISVFEVGASLFASTTSTSSTPDVAADPSARNATFPDVTVDRAGGITLPFIGRLQVAGRTPADIQQMIERGLAGKSQNPQVLVSVRQNIANRIFVGGDVKKPGSIPLTLGDETLTDAIALSGGPAFTSDDMLVRLHRKGRTGEEWLADLTPGGADDVPLAAGDRIEVLHRPRTFTVFGAALKVSQVPFENSQVSLAEAIARVGGPNDDLADPRAIFLFRYATSVGADGTIVRPVIYRLDMMEPASYFLSQKFAIRDKDVLYIANASAVQPTKFVTILSKLFSPVVAIRAVSRR